MSTWPLSNKWRLRSVIIVLSTIGSFFQVSFALFLTTGEMLCGRTVPEKHLILYIYLCVSEGGGRHCTCVSERKRERGTLKEMASNCQFSSHFVGVDMIFLFFPISQLSNVTWSQTQASAHDTQGEICVFKRLFVSHFITNPFSPPN